jgi:hypothetical protein
MITKYTLSCMAPDGATVREGEFETVEAAWRRASDMGSRWYFYPICMVTGLARGDKARIVAVPDGMPKDWIGRTVGTLAKACAADSEHACDYANGNCPFCIFP